MKVPPLLAVGVMAVAMVAAPLTVAAVSDDAPGASGDHARHHTGRPAWAGPDREALPPGISKRGMTKGKGGEHFVPPGLAKKHGEKATPPGHAKGPKGLKKHGHGKALGHEKKQDKKG